MTRTDLPYLRRRLKQPAAAAATATGARPATYSLDLSATSRDRLDAAPAPAAVTASTRTALEPVQIVDGHVTLTAESPVARLNRRTSAIGSLRISGARDAAWETTDLSSGVVGRDTPPAPGHRPIVERYGTDLIVGLRHIRTLRRLAASGKDMTITTLGGHTVQLAGEADLTIGVIDGVIELRREPVSTNLTATYSIGSVA